MLATVPLWQQFWSSLLKLFALDFGLQAISPGNGHLELFLFYWVLFLFKMAKFKDKNNRLYKMDILKILKIKVINNFDFLRFLLIKTLVWIFIILNNWIITLLLIKVLRDNIKKSMKKKVCSKFMTLWWKCIKILVLV